MPYVLHCALVLNLFSKGRKHLNYDWFSPPVLRGLGTCTQWVAFPSSSVIGWISHAILRGECLTTALLESVLPPVASQFIRHDGEGNTWLADVMGYFRLFSESADIAGGVALTLTPVALADADVSWTYLRGMHTTTCAQLASDRLLHVSQTGLSPRPHRSDVTRARLNSVVGKVHIPFRSSTSLRIADLYLRTLELGGISRIYDKETLAFVYCSQWTLASNSPRFIPALLMVSSRKTLRSHDPPRRTKMRQ